MDGTYTNTQRLIQWHDRAADPPGDARSDLWFTVQLGLRLKQLYADEQARARPADPGPDLGLHRPRGERAAGGSRTSPRPRRVLKEMNGYDVATGKPVKGFGDLKADGSTACGAWIYSGVYAADARGARRPQPRRQPQRRRLGGPRLGLRLAGQPPDHVQPRLGRPAGQPLAQGGPPRPPVRQRGRRATSTGTPTPKGPDPADPSKVVRGRWVGLDVPDFPVTKPPTAPAKPDGLGLDFHDGASPFIMKADGKGWLFAPSGLVDGPLPTHYEPYESPVANLVYPGTVEQPDGQGLRTSRATPTRRSARPSIPCVLSTYRLTEHHLSGSMSRWLPWLAALQPELFVELSPEHAGEIGAANLDVVRDHHPPRRRSTPRRWSPAASARS